MDDAISSVRISQTIAPLPTAEADAPAPSHGEIAERPIPVPSATSISDKAAATNAPANTAAQDTPEECASFFVSCSACEVCSGTDNVRVAMRVSSRRFDPVGPTSLLCVLTFGGGRVASALNHTIHTSP